VLIYLHGGGYVSGSKHHEARALLHRLARHGWVCLSADYRLRPEAEFIDHVTDAKSVIIWARQHAGDWGGDARTIVISGSSAGGHLATLAALTPGDPAFQSGVEDTDTSVSAAIGLYGYYGRYYGRGRAEDPPSTPLAYDVELAPPVLLVTAENDTYVGTEGAEALSEHLRASSRRPVVHAVLPGAQHAFDVFRSVRFEAVIDAIEVFVDEVLDAPASPGRGEQPSSIRT
jgi:acetyl esterase/lipase